MVVEKFIQDMQGKEITKQEGNFSTLLFTSIFPGCFSPYMDRFYDFDFGSFAYINKGNYGAIFFDLQKYYDCSRATYKKFELVDTEDDLIEIKDFQELWQETDILYKKCNPSFIGNLNSEELHNLIIKACDIVDKMIIATVFSEGTGDQVIKELLEQAGGQKELWEDFWQTVSLSGFESFVIREDKLLMQNGIIKDFYELQWLLTDYSSSPLISDIKDQMGARIKDKGGLDTIKEEYKQKIGAIKNNIKLINDYKKKLNPALQKLVDYIQLAMEVRDTRKEPALKILTIIANVAREIANRLDLGQDDVEQMITPYDFINGTYKQKGYSELIKARKKGIQMYVNTNGMETEVGPINEAKKMLFQAMPGGNENINEFKGVIACKGIVNGKVKIILSKEDFNKFNKDEILVTSMTRQEFVSLMKKAGAIVTDEGGVTCHAAIVSRELKKPCIIGTKIATQVLKDGDEVEVDADEGIVRIINK